METNFETIKTEILRRAKAAGACAVEYGRAYKSETLPEPCNVVKDNFNWAVSNKVITSDLLMQFREDFAKNEIYVNGSVNKGFLLACDSATVEACDSAYCISYTTTECKLSDNAIYRVRSTNTIYFASDNINFVKQ